MAYMRRQQAFQKGGENASPPKSRLPTNSGAVGFMSYCEPNQQPNRRPTLQNPPPTQPAGAASNPKNYARRSIVAEQAEKSGAVGFMNFAPEKPPTRSENARAGGAMGIMDYIQSAPTPQGGPEKGPPSGGGSATMAGGQRTTGAMGILDYIQSGTEYESPFGSLSQQSQPSQQQQQQQQLPEKPEKTGSKFKFGRKGRESKVVPSSVAASLSALDDYAEDEDDIRYGEDKTIIKAATLERLLDRLCKVGAGVEGTKYRDSFLLTYRAFTTPSELFQSLVLSYDPTNITTTSEITKKRVRVIGVLKAWVENFFFDFQQDESLQKQYDNFLSDMNLTMKTSSTQLQKVFQKMSTEKEKESRESFDVWAVDSPSVGMIESLRNGGWKNLITEKDLAMQMTVIESEMYCSILPKECLAWNKKNKEELAPNISRMIHHFNRVSNWVSSQIVTVIKRSERILLLERFIRLMENLMDLNNFNGMMEILSGINSSAVRRMKKTFSGLSGDYPEKYKALEKLLAHAHTYKKYREHLHKITPPCVPYLGVYLTDLTFVLDGNPDRVEGGTLINFFKWRKVADIITEIKNYQIRYKSLQVNHQTRTFLLSLEFKDSEECYKWSTRVEPKHYEKAIDELIRSESALKHKLEKLKIEEREMRRKYNLLKGLEDEEDIKKENEERANQSGLHQYLCLWSFSAQNDKEISVNSGEKVLFIEEINDDWALFSKFNGAKGYLPRNVVRPLMLKNPKKKSLQGKKSNSCSSLRTREREKSTRGKSRKNLADYSFFSSSSLSKQMESAPLLSVSSNPHLSSLTAPARSPSLATSPGRRGRNEMKEKKEGWNEKRVKRSTTTSEAGGKRNSDNSAIRVIGKRRGTVRLKGQSKDS
eukprot:CAMPEP_0201502282 /NCGR_PEP_ID=MMETSP0151_2-20130828/84050_1 /ASSEMBLY_ACC=CAM_ASM_000257 /TAXON_ID=200890 /ORGANISM="Paramoeba atlantica, Strain 621/1 / CCAP 1560/9" /LENGTH=875 /DNA_ID=CAMNT_0047895863 /DNA_START=103 /DNA_END=2730 /DNA_ORIENTATION=-